MQITIATSIQYGNYKQTCLERVEKVKALIRYYMDAFKQEFDFDPNVVVHFRPIKGNYLGKAYDKKNLIEIDPRYSYKDIIETIAHELVHSEQYKQGRLKHVSGNASLWYNQSVSRGSTYKQYLALPWEVEARKRAAEFLTKHFTHAYLDIR